MNLYSSSLSVNLVNKNVTYTKGDTILVNSACNVKKADIDHLIKNYVTYWESASDKSSSESDRTVEITIYTDKNILSYRFAHTFPEDLEEFIRAIKKLVGIDI